MVTGNRRHIQYRFPWATYSCRSFIYIYVHTLFEISHWKSIWKMDNGEQTELGPCGKVSFVTLSNPEMLANISGSLPSIREQW